MAKGDQGKVVVEVTFDSAGRVATCRALQTSASSALTAHTCDFIKANWHSSQYAGKTADVPIIYELPGFNRGLPGKLPHPPYPVRALNNGDQGTVVVQVTFGGDGHVAHCQILGSSAPESLQTFTSDFIFAHWVSKPCAGQTYTIPIIYAAARN